MAADAGPAGGDSKDAGARSSSPSRPLMSRPPVPCLHYYAPLLHAIIGLPAYRCPRPNKHILPPKRALQSSPHPRTRALPAHNNPTPQEELEELRREAASLKEQLEEEKSRGADAKAEVSQLRADLADAHAALEAEKCACLACLRVFCVACFRALGRHFLAGLFGGGPFRVVCCSCRQIFCEMMQCTLHAAPDTHARRLAQTHRSFRAGRRRRRRASRTSRSWRSRRPSQRRSRRRCRGS